MKIKKTKYQLGMIVSSSLGMFLWGVIASIAPLATSWPFVSSLPKVYLSIFLFLPTTFMIIGNLTLGILADRIGRKFIYILSTILYGLGFLVIFLSYNVYSLVLGIALSEFGVGGEEVATLTIISENIPLEERGLYLVFIPNMNNIGSAVIAFIFMYFYSSSIYVQKLYFIFIALAAVAIAFLTRYSVPESYRWLRDKGKISEAQEEKKKIALTPEPVRIKAPNFYYALAFLAVLGISQYLTFGLMAYIIGPYYFSGSTVSLIIFIASLGASVAGFIAMFMVNWGRKKLALFSFIGGTLTIFIILLLLKEIVNMLVFMPLLFINMMFSEFAWATRTTIEPEIFPTLKRSSAIALVRLFPGISYIVSIYATASFTLMDYIIFNAILWGLGAAASIIWYIKGIETKHISMDFIQT
ncbi:MAG: MFS transporter [Thermoplasmata archaeon]|nr:MFS transporter [Thermoplasmata archaeon]